MKSKYFFNRFVGFFFFFHLFTNSMLVGSDDYKYGRICVNSPIFTIGVGTHAINRSDFYNDISEEATARRSLILEKEKKTENENGKSLNIASFAIEFLDKNGLTITKKPIFFGHSVNDNNCLFLEKIIQPYFFLSGRHAKENIGENISSLGLSVKSPTEEFRKLKQSTDGSGNEDIKKSVLNFRKYFIDLLPFERIWFNSLVERSSKAKEDLDNIMKCTMEGSKDYCMLKQSDEGLFAHSEQLALALMQSDLYNNNLYKMLKEVQKYYDLREKTFLIVFHIYTYNTMCARCARSIFYDFRIKRNLKKFFNKLKPTRFIIAATREYKDTIHRDGEPKSSDTSPHDYSYSGNYPIPFMPGSKMNDYLYQWLIEPKQSKSSFTILVEITRNIFYDRRFQVPVCMFLTPFVIKFFSKAPENLL